MTVETIPENAFWFDSVLKLDSLNSRRIRDCQWGLGEQMASGVPSVPGGEVLLDGKAYQLGAKSYFGCSHSAGQ